MNLVNKYEAALAWNDLKPGKKVMFIKPSYDSSGMAYLTKPGPITVTYLAECDFYEEGLCTCKAMNYYASNKCASGIPGTRVYANESGSRENISYALCFAEFANLKGRPYKTKRTDES